MLLLGLGWLLSDSSAADMTQSADLIPISPKETRKGDPKTTMWTQEFLTQPCAVSNRSLRHAGLLFLLYICSSLALQIRCQGVNSSPELRPPVQDFGVTSSRTQEILRPRTLL